LGRGSLGGERGARLRVAEVSAGEGATQLAVGDGRGVAAPALAAMAPALAAVAASAAATLIAPATARRIAVLVVIVVCSSG
jgi:hypothetical protein